MTWVHWALLALFAILFAPNIFRYFAADKSMAFDHDDPQFAAAVEEARKALPQFWALLENSSDGNALTALKLGLDIGNNSREHVWAVVERDVRTTRKARLMNRPHSLKLYEGDVLDVNFDDITDWLYRTETESLGQHTIRVMLARLPAKQAREMAELHGLPYPQ